LKTQTFGLEQTNWADKFWGILGQIISTHFGTVSPLSIIQPLFLKKQLSRYIRIPNMYLFEIGI
jgi:hypothetical protein